MILTGNQFTYNNTPSTTSDWNLRFMWMDEKPQTNMAGTKKYTYAKNHTNNSYTVVGTDYDGPLSFSVEFFSDHVLTETEVRNIYKAYFNLPKFQAMTVYDAYTSCAQNGVLAALPVVAQFDCLLVNPEIHEYGLGDDEGIVGFTATMVLATPFVKGSQKTTVLSGDSSERSSVVTAATTANGYPTYSFTNETDSHEFLYPDVDIYLPALTGSDDIILSIQNTNDSVTGVNGVVNNRTITISKTAGSGAETFRYKPRSGTIKTVTNLVNVINRTNKKFIRLVPGTNTFAITCTDSDGENITSLGTFLEGIKITLTYREDKVIL